MLEAAWQTSMKATGGHGRIKKPQAHMVKQSENEENSREDSIMRRQKDLLGTTRQKETL